MKRDKIISGLIIGGMIGGFGFQLIQGVKTKFFTENIKPPAYTQKDISLVRIQKPKSSLLSYRQIWEEPFRYKGEYGKIETTIYPVKLSMPCGCSIVIESKEDFPKETVPCDCKENHYLLKLEEVEEEKGGV